MDFDKDLFPHCIVWTILPCITWLIPIIGHTGICDNQGIINDFLGYNINKKVMGFGRPVKYVPLEIEDQQRFEQCLQQANMQYSRTSHDLFCNNCHHHVARVLNLYSYQGKQDWTQVGIWWMCLWNSIYVSKIGLLKVYGPSLLIIGLIVLIVVLTSKRQQF